jgi:outer membrane protein assembly factor BamB
LVLKGLVIVSTNAKRVVAFSKETGEQVWATKLDGPAGFGPLLYKNLLAAVTNSIYLIDPESGKIVRRFTWNSYNIRQAESADRNIVVSLSRDSPYDKPKIVGLNKSGIRFAHVCRAFVEGIRYISETGLIYVSHGQGIEVRHHETGELAFNIEGKGDEWGYGPVDVKQNTIYALTDDGYVYALRHPPT